MAFQILLLLPNLPSSNSTLSLTIISNLSIPVNVWLSSSHLVSGILLDPGVIKHTAGADHSDRLALLSS